MCWVSTNLQGHVLECTAQKNGAEPMFCGGVVMKNLHSCTTPFFGFFLRFILDVCKGSSDCVLMNRCAVETFA